MEVKATARHVRLSPTKARRVIDLIRGRRLDDALAILSFSPKSASAAIEKVIRSAAANAESSSNLDTGSLVVAEAFVDQGPTMKRIMPRARGRANRIRKRTSHITVVLSEQ